MPKLTKREKVLRITEYVWERNGMLEKDVPRNLRRDGILDLAVAVGKLVRYLTYTYMPEGVVHENRLAVADNAIHACPECGLEYTNITEAIDCCNPQ